MPYKDNRQELIHLVRQIYEMTGISIYAFQEDYKTKEEREAFVAKLRNYEIDKLIDMCDSIQGKNYYEQQKKQEKVFGFSKHPALYCIGEAVPFVTVYDGPGTQKYAEYGDGLEETGKPD